MNWNKFSLFKLPNQNKRFDFEPRYYDADKEALNKKLRLAKAADLLDKDGKQEREIKFKAQVDSKWGNAHHKTESMRSNIRLVIIMIVLLAVFYYVFIGLDGLGYLIDTNLDKLK